MNKLIQTPYQLIGLTKLRLNNLASILITDGVGVGKTISAAYIISYYAMKFERAVYVISPMGLVDKWVLELKEKFGFDPVPIRNIEQLRITKNECIYHDFSKNPKVYVVSNTFLRRDFDGTLDIDPGLLVIDEIHNFRNAGTVGFSNLKKICEKALVRVGLSATPFNNSFSDVVSIYHLLFPNYERYTIDAIIDEIWDSEKISPILTKFEKENLGIHFAKREINLHRITYPSKYIEFIRDKIRIERHRESDSEKFYLDEIMWFRLATSSPFAFYHSAKFRDCKDEVQELIDGLSDNKLKQLLKIISQKSEERVIIFCEFLNTVKYIQKNLPPGRKVYCISGEVMLASRIELFDQFRKDKTGILILTSVGSEGIDLQFCSTVINYDLHWNPMKLEQRIGRIDRVGQKKSTISIHNLMIANSIDEQILIKLYDKLEMIENTIFSPKDILESLDLDEILLEKLDKEEELALKEQMERAEVSFKKSHSEDITSYLKPPKLYFEELFETQEQKAKEHITTLKKNKNIELDDYQIYSNIKKEYCDPALLKELGKSGKELPWIQENILGSWLKNITYTSKEIKKVMEDYNT